MNKDKMTDNSYKQLCIDIYSSIASGAKWECRCKGNRTCSTCEIGTCPDESWRPFNMGEAIHPDFEYRQCPDRWVVNRHKGNQNFVIKYIIVTDEEFHKNWSQYGYYLHGTEKECLEYIEANQEASWVDDNIDKLTDCRNGGDLLTHKDIYYYERGMSDVLRELKKRLKPFKTISVSTLSDVLYRMGIRIL